MKQKLKIILIIRQNQLSGNQSKKQNVLEHFLPQYFYIEMMIIPVKSLYCPVSWLVALFRLAILLCGHHTEKQSN